MKKILCFAVGLLVLEVSAMAQTPPGFTKVNQNYNWLGGKFDNVLGVNPKDTLTAPLFIGEFRIRTTGGDSTLYIGLSLTGKKWYRQGGGNFTLQQVTDAGNVTTNPIQVIDGGGNSAVLSTSGLFVNGSSGQIMSSPSQLYLQNPSGTEVVKMYNNRYAYEFQYNNGSVWNSTFLKFDYPTNNNTITFPDKSGTVAVGSDLTAKADKEVSLSTLADGATITWDYATQGTEAKVTLAGNRTLSITNLPAGKVVYLTLGVTQDATGSRTLTLPAGTKVINGGAGAVTLTTTANATDILCFRWNGTTLFCTYGKNYN